MTWRLTCNYFPQSSGMALDGEELSSDNNNKEEINDEYTVNSVEEDSITDEDVAVQINMASN